jgi:branched-chain amino acid transport system permease protein
VSRGIVSRGLLIRLGVIGVLAVVFALVPFGMSGYHQLQWGRVGMYYIALLGFNIVLGYTGQISIGHGAFMAIGGYTTAVLVHYEHWGTLATFPAAFALCFICGVVLGLPALRLSGVYLALATFAVAVSVPQIALKYSKFLGGRNGIQIASPRSNIWFYGVAWACAAILFVLAWLILRGRIGRAFRAVRDSEVAAASSGVNLAIYKTLAFGISAAFAGVAGALFVLATNGFANPDEFGVFLSLKILIGAAIAGLGSLWGVLIGAIFITLLPDVSQNVPLLGSQHGTDIAFGAVVILTMFFLPNGFAGLLRQLIVASRRLRRPAPAAGAAEAS